MTKTEIIEKRDSLFRQLENWKLQYNWSVRMLEKRENTVCSIRRNLDEKERLYHINKDSVLQEEIEKLQDFLNSAKKDNKMLANGIEKITQEESKLLNEINEFDKQARKDLGLGPNDDLIEFLYGYVDVTAKNA